MRWSILVLLLIVDLAAAAPTTTDELAVLRDPMQHWGYELVGGASLATLAKIPKGPPVTCSVTDVTASGSRIVCDTSAMSGSPLVSTLLGSHTLVFDDAGVHELENGAPLALTFPKRLVPDRVVETTAKDGTIIQIRTRLDVMVVRDVRRDVWISEATTTTPPRGTEKPAPRLSAVAVFASGVGPVMLCRIRAAPRPAYVCLRMHDVSASPPTPTVSVARTAARMKTSLTATQLAAKVTRSYVAGIKRCYADLLRSRPGVEGTLSLLFTVNAVGKIEDITAKSFDPTFTSCARKRVAGWRFPIPLSVHADPIATQYELDLKLALKAAR